MAYAFFVFNKYFFNKKLVILRRKLIKNCTFGVIIFNASKLKCVYVEFHLKHKHACISKVYACRNVNVENKIIL